MANSLFKTHSSCSCWASNTALVQTMTILKGVMSLLLDSAATEKILTKGNFTITLIFKVMF